jgi:nucleoside-diphosphate-sugar epimerase
MVNFLQNSLASHFIESDGHLAITGATGWVGSTAVHELLTLLSPSVFADRVRLFASRAGSLSISGAYSGSGDSPAFILPVHSLQYLPELASAKARLAILHTAFLTRDRLAAMGQEAYVTTNRWITSQVAQALSLAPLARAVVISSGAAAPYDALKNPIQRLATDPYGVLKHLEETTLAELAPSLVVRIYALTGYFIRNPHRFALGEFLSMALRGEPIRLDASMPVFRSYGHAGDITALSLRWLIGSEQPLGVPLPAVSLGIDLYSLAQKVSDLYSLPPVQATIDPEAEANRYLADPQPFLASLSRYGLVPKSLEDQIQDTAAGLLEHSLCQLD